MTVMTGTTDNTMFDPLAWLSQQSRKAAKAPPEGMDAAQHSPASQPASPEEELAMARAVANELLRIGANIAEDYHDYVRLGFALASGLGSDGRSIFHMLCAHSTKYSVNECERKWRECLRKSDGRTTIATYYHMAREAGVDIKKLRKLRS